MFGLFNNDFQTGFIALEKPGNDMYYIEKLSVLPECRHNLYGSKLINFAFDFIKKDKGKTVSIGIIEEHKILKEWYMKFGFTEVSLQKFNHLPFTVCFMEKNL